MPRWPKNIDGLWEDVIIDESSIHGEQPHQEDDVSTTKEYVPYLKMIKIFEVFSLPAHIKGISKSI